MEDSTAPATTSESAFCYKAATYAVIAPVAAFASSFLTSALHLMLARSVARVVNGVIAQLEILLLLSAIPAGIIALRGIPRYGKRKLLWKGLFGILVSILMLVLVTWGFFLARRYSEERARQLQSGH